MNRRLRNGARPTDCLQQLVSASGQEQARESTADIGIVSDDLITMSRLAVA